MSERKQIDWEAIEREYRAGQFSVREIARQHNLSETAIRKRAKLDGWTRPLADKVREAVREKLVRADGSHGQRADKNANRRVNDSEIVENSAVRGFNVVSTHRRDIEQLHALKRILATRLSDILHGAVPDGPCLGEKESPGDLLEKLSRVTTRLIPLERQAFNLDAESGASGALVTLAKEDRYL